MIHKLKSFNSSSTTYQSKSFAIITKESRDDALLYFTPNLLTCRLIKTAIWSQKLYVAAVTVCNNVKFCDQNDVFYVDVVMGKR